MRGNIRLFRTIARKNIGIKRKKMPSRGRHFSFFVQLGMKRENLYGLDKPFGNLVIIGRLLDMTGQKAFPMF